MYENLKIHVRSRNIDFISKFLKHNFNGEKNLSLQLGHQPDCSV